MGFYRLLGRSKAYKDEAKMAFLIRSEIGFHLIGDRYFLKAGENMSCHKIFKITQKPGIYLHLENVNDDECGDG